MSKLLLATLTLFLSLAPISVQAEALISETNPESWSESTSFETENMVTLRRPRPRPKPIYRCCAKPADVYGEMNCTDSTDKLLGLSDAIINCENRYGKGHCVSGCRRLK